MHPVRLLLDRLPELLVELGTVARSGRTVAGAALAGRLARRDGRGAARRSGRSIPALPLPYDYELRKSLPKEPQSGESHRRDQGDDGRAAGVISLQTG